MFSDKSTRDGNLLHPKSMNDPLIDQNESIDTNIALAERQSVAVKPRKTETSGYFSHLFILLWKHLITFRRRYSSTILILISPTIAIFLLAYFQFTMEIFMKKTEVDYPVVDIPDYIPKCFVGKNEDRCVSVSTFILVIIFLPFILFILELLISFVEISGFRRCCSARLG